MIVEIKTGIGAVCKQKIAENSKRKEKENYKLLKQILFTPKICKFLYPYQNVCKDITNSNNTKVWINKKNKTGKNKNKKEI